LLVQLENSPDSYSRKPASVRIVSLSPNCIMTVRPCSIQISIICSVFYCWISWFCFFFHSTSVMRAEDEGDRSSRSEWTW
jgi:hypothetical protein